MSVPIGKHVLVVGPEDGRLRQLEPALNSFGFDAMFVTDVAAASQIVESMLLLSLVVIDGTIGEAAGGELLRAIKDQHSDLPVAWIATRSSPAPVSRRGHAPDILIQHPVDLSTLRDDVEQLLRQHLYPRALSDHLAAACKQAMLDAYRVELSLAGINLRANRTALGSVTAVLPFVGRRISGRMMVGSDAGQLAAIRCKALRSKQPPTQEEIDDFAGEYANIVVGRVKAHFASLGLDFAVGTPVVISGEGSTLSYRASRPTLVLSFSSEVGGLRVALCFDVLELPNGARAGLGTTEADITTGEDTTERTPAAETGEIVFL